LEERNMKAYLLTWNPIYYSWEQINQERINHEISWRCASKQPKLDDMFFICALGQSPRKGIFGSGVVETLLDDTIDYGSTSKITNCIRGEVKILLNPEKQEILDLAILQKEFPNQRWDPPSSGIEIENEYVEKLKSFWEAFLNGQKIFEDNEVPKEFWEGNPQRRSSTVYERSGSARSACIKKHGYKCAVCGMVMEEKYGEVGKDFIHIHHKDFISGYATGHEIDPITDLIPVCPNCHSMLHRKISGKYLNIDELKNILVQRGNHVR
jgi:5-methylcytosine-specific restriction protein A